MLNDKEKVSRELEQWIKKLKCSGSTGLSLGQYVCWENSFAKKENPQVVF